MACVTTQVPRHTVAILGGGIAGLSTAYYINRKFGPSVRPVVLEASGRTGGWMQSFEKDGSLYEIGPRTIRPNGTVGLNTLDLVEEIGLAAEVQYVPPEHPSARNRLIYSDDKLIRVPTSGSIMWKATEPFDQPLLRVLLKEIVTSKKDVGEDDSLHAFVSRRLGPRIADKLIDPLIRGICAGDARKISAKFLLGPTPLQLEQQYGSVLRGAIWKTLLRKSNPDPHADVPGVDTIGESGLSKTARQQGWAVWSLAPGLGVLPQRLEEKLTESGIKVLKNSPVKSITFDDSLQKNQVEYLDPETQQPAKLECSHIISALPAWNLATILEASRPLHSSLSNFLKTIQGTDVTVTNLKFADKLLELNAFGFLVPSTEKKLEGLLGVVFNTSVFPQGNDTILTCMSQGIDVDRTHKYVTEVLGASDPSYVDVKTLEKCIPQYTVGHYERVKELREYIKNYRLPLTLVGASYDGVSVNDSLFSGRKASEYLPFDSP